MNLFDSKKDFECCVNCSNCEIIFDENFGKCAKCKENHVIIVIPDGYKCKKFSFLGNMNIYEMKKYLKFIISERDYCEQKLGKHLELVKFHKNKEGITKLYRKYLSGLIEQYLDYRDN